MKHVTTKIAAAVLLATIGASAQATTLTFVNGLGTNPYPGATNTSAFSVGAEFRMVDPTGALGGGFPLQKNTINGGEQWVFSNASNLMTGVAGTATTGGSGVPGSAAPLGGAGLDQGALFFGQAFGFLAPIVGSQAGTAYGAGVFNLGGLIDGVANVGDTFSISMATAEAQWGGTHFPLANIVFNGTITGAGGAFHMWAEHKILASEDVGSAGFANWTAQWNYHGNVTDIAPVPEASTYGMMLAGLGLVGFAVRRRKLMA